MVAFHALDGRIDDFDVGAVLVEDAVANALDGGLAGAGVANDASLADVFAASFELRLDEDDGLTAPRLAQCAEGGEDRGEDESGRDERDVHCEEGWSWMRGGEEFAGGQEAGVGALAERDAGIVAEFLGDLAVAGVDSEDRLCAALQHTVGEASGGGSDVDASEAGEIDGPVGEGVFEFEAAAADVLEVGAEEADGGGSRDGGAGLVNSLLVDEDAAGEDEGLGAFAGDGVTLVDEKFVEASLFGAGLLVEALFCGIGHLFALSHAERAGSIFSWLRIGPGKEKE